MSTNCLVTKLKASVNNDSLIKITDFLVHFSSGTGTVLGGEIVIKYNVPNQVIKMKEGKLFYNGSRVDSINTGEANTQINFGCVPSSLSDVLILPNKENITFLNQGVPASYVYGVEGLNNITDLYLNKSFSGKTVHDLPNLDILAFSYWGDTPVNLSDITNCPKLMTLNCNNSNNVTGDIATITGNVRTATFGSGNNYVTLSWSNRDTSKNILELIRVNLGNDIDKYFNNIAQCVNPPASQKRIIVNGSRTSASDSAINSLKSMGYSITVNGETL